MYIAGQVCDNKIFFYHKIAKSKNFWKDLMAGGGRFISDL